ncbi:MAG: hypothetical protein Q8L48_11700 [Archangium sp.]|nr:hypothetical protein [Archangium sp.]
MTPEPSPSPPPSQKLGPVFIIAIVLVLGAALTVVCVQLWKDSQARQAYCSQCTESCACSPDRRELMVHLCASPNSTAKTCLSSDSTAAAGADKGDLKLHGCLEDEGKKDPAVAAMMGKVDELMRQRYREQCLRPQLTPEEEAEKRTEALIDRVRQLQQNEYTLARSTAPKAPEAAAEVLRRAPGLAGQLLGEDETRLAPSWRVDRLRFAGIAFLAAAVLEPEPTVRGNYARKASDCFQRALNALDALVTPEEEEWAVSETVRDNLRYLSVTSMAIRCALGEELKGEAKRMFEDINPQYRRDHPPKLIELKQIIEGP